MSSQGVAWPKCQSIIRMFRCIKEQNVNKYFPNFTSCSLIGMMLYLTVKPKNAITQLPAKVLAAGNSNAFLFDLTRAYLYTIWKTLLHIKFLTSMHFLFSSGFPCRTHSQDPQMTLRLLLVVLLFNLILQVQSHGRLMEPVSRASAWRKGFKNPADYNDNEGYCGGYSVKFLFSKMTFQTNVSKLHW